MGCTGSDMDAGGVLSIACGGDDCDDSDPDRYLDADHDGYGDPGDTVSSCERQPGRVLTS